MNRTWSDADKTRFATEQQQRLDQLQEQLATGLEQMMEAQGWIAWLHAARHFHTYSFNNQLLIALQHPDATQVAGYRTWQTAGRQVRRGETGIRILAPITKPATTPDGTPIQDPKGNQRRDIIGVKPTTVFDISQTDGPPLPDAPTAASAPLRGPAPEGMWDNLHTYATRTGFTVATGPCPAEGLTNFLTRTVTIREGFDPAHAASVLAHEVGHVTMHNPTTPETQARPYCRGMVEVEAESYAWTVNQHWGLDSTTDSFNYLAGWATSAAREQQTTPSQIIAASAERVRTAINQYLKQQTTPAPNDHPIAALARSVEIKPARHSQEPQPSPIPRTPHRPHHDVALHPAGLRPRGR